MPGRRPDEYCLEGVAGERRDRPPRLRGLQRSRREGRAGTGEARCRVATCLVRGRNRGERRLSRPCGHRRLPEGSGGDLGDGLRTPRAAHAIDDHVLVEVVFVAVGRISGVRVERTTWKVIEVRDGKVASGCAYEAEGLRSRRPFEVTFGGRQDGADLNFRLAIGGPGYACARDRTRRVVGGRRAPSRGRLHARRRRSRCPGGDVGCTASRCRPGTGRSCTRRSARAARRQPRLPRLRRLREAAPPRLLAARAGRPRRGGVACPPCDADGARRPRLRRLRRPGAARAARRR